MRLFKRFFLKYLDDNYIIIIFADNNQMRYLFMNKELRDKLSYFITCIAVFGEHFDLQPKQAFAYLKHFGGLAFLDECYAAEHMLSLDDAVNDMSVICKRNGGGLG